LRVEKAADGSVHVERIPVIPMTEEMKQVVEEQK
jgi:hypothetical protein